MTIIVKDKTDGNEYIVIGTGLGKYKSVTSHALFGDWLPSEESGETLAITVCNKNGQAPFFYKNVTET